MTSHETYHSDVHAPGMIAPATPISDLTVGELQQVIADAVRASREAEIPAARMVWIQDLANEKGLAVSTVYRHMDRRGIPARQKDGAPKRRGDRGRTYVCTAEYDEGRGLPTRTVRRLLGK